MRRDEDITLKLYASKNCESKFFQKRKWRPIAVIRTLFEQIRIRNGDPKAKNDSRTIVILNFKLNCS